MTFGIAEPCIGTKDSSCVDVCPVDCIHPTKDSEEFDAATMLYIDPACVDMSKAANDYHPGKGPLTPNADEPGVYSPTGIYGDATLATVEKGKTVVEATVAALVQDITELRQAPLPDCTDGQG